MSSEGVHSIELTEFYLEPLLVTLEPVVARIYSGFPEEIWFLGKDCSFLGLWNTLVSLEGVHSIELIEFHLELFSLFLEPAVGRILPGFTLFFQFF